MFLARKLKKWSENQLISEGQAQAILAFEKNSGRARIHFGLGGLGVLSILLGIVSLIAANWDVFSPTTKLVNHTLLNVVLAGVILKFFQKPSWIREILVTVLAGLVMTYIALVGQVLQTQAPLWQPLGVWLVLVTPMLLLYARFSGIVAVWLGIIGVFSHSFALNVLTEPQQQVFFAGLPFALFIAFGFQKVKTVLPNWTFPVHRVFWVLIVLGTSLAQIFWHQSTSASHAWLHIPMASVVAAGVGTLLVFLLNSAARHNLAPFWSGDTREWDAVLVVSYILGALPILLSPHPALGFVGALMFCLYWLFLGGMGLRLGIDRLWSFAVFAVGARIFIAYIQIMGSLAIQGLGFIFTGVIFLALAWTTRKIMQTKPRWLMAQCEGVQP